MRDERLSLADFLDGLTADDWNRDSLCDGWTVHDVLAHVALADLLLAATGRLEPRTLSPA
ncbi:maleylpyruvate isomerase family mycothiol-dependent enzyme [Nocardia otitidiscaviarum]|uniref:maleylpyruvate isomerase family mycothiol-dependent enzyme n=1 Tax=Nocardia otitidiscaviarum TaxID=1823 RepID=UPI0004A7541C|nr:maleylpyruvate isomerase family mycothiol-dependent enzyme [Nocardia otitidiscaviarum]